MTDIPYDGNLPFHDPEHVSVPITEEERDGFTARERFRKITQAALEQFWAEIMDGKQPISWSMDDLGNACRKAAEEHRRLVSRP